VWPNRNQHADKYDGAQGANVLVAHERQTENTHSCCRKTDEEVLLPTDFVAWVSNQNCKVHPPQGAIGSEFTRVPGAVALAYQFIKWQEHHRNQRRTPKANEQEARDDPHMGSSSSDKNTQNHNRTPEHLRVPA